MNPASQRSRHFWARLAALVFAWSLMVPFGAQAADDPWDIAGWQQVPEDEMYGLQWPPDGLNPDYRDWSPPNDGQTLRILALTQTLDREISYGDPPVSFFYSSFTNIAFEFWIDGQGAMHYWGSYTYEDSDGKKVDQIFIGRRKRAPGSPPDSLSSLDGMSLPTDLSVYQNVSNIPEPAPAAMCLASLMALVGARHQGRLRRNQA